MYYSYELLSLRKKGKLSRCWLAATLTEKKFKEICKPGLIKKIDLTVTCEEILLIMQTTSDVPNKRFSLYLSAQLMYGITKLFLYKTLILEADVFSEFSARPFRGQRNDFHFDQRTVQDFPDVRSLTEELRDAEPPLDLHLIRDESYQLAVQHTMQDAEFQNFGMLTFNDGMDLLLPQPEDLPLRDLQIRHFTENITNPEQLVDVSMVDIDTLETEVLPLSGTTTREHLVELNLEDVQASPRKRSLTPSVQTPTKRSKLILEELAPVREEEPPELAAPVIQQRRETRRRRLIVDAHTQLDTKVIRNWLSNVQAHTTIFQKANLESTEALFNYPSTSKNGSRWRRELLDRYKSHLIAPTMPRNDSPTVTAEAELFTSIEAVMEETAGSKSKIAELSSQITALGVRDTSEPSNVVEHTVPVEEVLVEKERTEGSIHDQLEDTLIPLPHISELEQQVENIEIGERKSTPKSSPCSSSSRSKPPLTKRDLQGLLEVHWHDRQSVKFRDVIPPESYDRLDATYAFNYILEFHKDRFLVLQQANPFEPIWIQKYDVCSSPTSDYTDLNK